MWKLEIGKEAVPKKKRQNKTQWKAQKGVIALNIVRACCFVCTPRLIAIMSKAEGPRPLYHSSRTPTRIVFNIAVRMACCSRRNNNKRRKRNKQKRMERVRGSPKDQQMLLPPISGDVIFNQNSDAPVDHDRYQLELTATGISPDNYNLMCRKMPMRSTLTLQNDFRLELDGSRLTRSRFCFLKKGKKKDKHLFRSHQINLPGCSTRMLWEPISPLIVIRHD